ncbi:hypothetical protein [Chondromyces crocatus]|uniref:Uncharacterized protein n=1 Tax=Chondromyces crocatus TaxID=52 RepID=A0A0K1EPV1_CHOCO|nr:hypothetical protein [Chondromyces crocatus]AKT42881.1 uncharacterized protein CMC5_071090 [Chondromyces crocatus]
MSVERRLLHRGAERYHLVERGAARGGERIHFASHHEASAFLSGFLLQTGNVDVLQAAAEDVRGGAPWSARGRLDDDPWAPLADALVSGSIELIQIVDHPVSPCEVRTTGTLTLSEVSWGETAGIYPSNKNLYSPAKWEQEKLCSLLRARAAVDDVAKRNSHVRKAKPSTGNIDQMLKPYHCIENFPDLEAEIDERVQWFYLSSEADKPETHPGAMQRMEIARSYGPFHNVGGGDVAKGDVWLHFYRLAPKG